jgi:transmembrane sensor
MSKLDQLGRRLADLQDRRLAESRHDRSPPSPALGDHLLRRSSERRSRYRIAVVSAAALLVVGGTVGGLRLRPTQHSDAIATVRAEAGQRVAASLLDLALAFDDGSRVVLSSGASLRTDMVGPTSASLELERGRATVRVVHTRTTHWTVRAGTYQVAVTGTRFRLDWKPENGAFSVAVEEGSVRVSGGLLTMPLDIVAGQSIALEHGRASRPAVSTAPEPVAAPSTAALSPTPPSRLAAQPPAPGLMPTPVETESTVLARRPVSHHPAAAPISWREEAEAGRYRDALAEAERKGFDGICREASGADLLTLAEAARYAGRSDRAERALKMVRARFGSGEDAAVAAFLLGRIAAETHHDHVAAARWFRTYLTERPGGRLDREAEGRLLESLAFMDRNTARAAASAYLQHYPTGPHAAFARNLLGH